MQAQSGGDFVFCNQFFEKKQSFYLKLICLFSSPHSY